LLNLSFRSASAFCLTGILLFLNISPASAVEKIRLTPASFSLKKGESKTLTLTGKNFKNAKSALVFLKKFPKKEFTTKLTCQGATRCIINLTVKGPIATGGYSLVLLDAKKKPIAEGQFKLTPLAGKTGPQSKRELKQKTKQPPLVGKTTPRSKQELKQKPEQSPLAGKTTPRSKRELKQKPEQSPLAEKTVRRPKSDLSSKQKRESPRGKRPPKLERFPGKPFALPELDSIKLAKQNAAPGEKVTGTVTLEKKVSARQGVIVSLSSSNRKIATVRPVRIPVGQNKAEFKIKTGQNPGAVKITAKLGKVMKEVKLVVKAPTTPPVVEEEEAEAPATPPVVEEEEAEAPVTPAEDVPFTPVTVTTESLEFSGEGAEAPFSPVTITINPLQMTGHGDASSSTEDVPFTPVTVNTESLEFSGEGAEASFNPVTITINPLQMTGHGEASSSTEVVPFTPVTVTTEALQLSGEGAE
jgi:hypothetical protein